MLAPRGLAYYYLEEGNFMRRVAAVAVGCILLTVNPVDAQPHSTTGVFVQGGPFASIELLPHGRVSSLVTPLVAPDASGTVAGGTIGMGAFLRPFLSLRAELAIPATLDQEEDNGISNLRVSSRTRVNYRDAYVLLGFETNAARRVRLSYLAGAVIRQQRSRRRLGILNEGLPPFLPPRVEILEDESVSYGTSLALGLDASAAVSRQLTVVPQVRLAVASGGLSVRPGMSVRWSF